MKGNKYILGQESEFFIRKIAASEENEIEIKQTDNYQISFQKGQYLIGAHSDGYFKLINLTKRKHSIFEIVIRTSSEDFMRMDQVFKKFFIYDSGRRIIFITGKTNTILEASIEPAENHKMELRDSFMRVNEIGNHEKGVCTFLDNSKFNKRTFVSGNDLGEIKLWHVILKESDSKHIIPCYSCFWKFEPFNLNQLTKSNQLTVQNMSLFNPNKKEFLLFCQNNENSLILINLKEKKIVSKSQLGSSKITKTKTISLQDGKTAIFIVDEKKTLFVYDCTNSELNLSKTIYLTSFFEKNCVFEVTDICTFFNTQLCCVVAGILRSANEEKYVIKIIGMEDNEVIKEFIFEETILFIDIIKKSRTGEKSDSLIVGNKRGILNAWEINLLFEEEYSKEPTHEEEELEEKEKEKEKEEYENEEEKTEQEEEEESEEEEEENEEEIEQEIQVIEEDDFPTPRDSPMKPHSDKNIERIMRTRKAHSMNSINKSSLRNENTRMGRNSFVFSSIEVPRNNSPVPTSLYSESSEGSNSIVGEEIEIIPKIKRNKKKKKSKYSFEKTKLYQAIKEEERNKLRNPKFNNDANIDINMSTNPHFGNPEEFMSILKQETIRNEKKLDGNDKEIVHRFQKRRKMTEEEKNRRIEEIQNKKFDEKKFLEEFYKDKRKDNIFQLPKQKIFEGLTDLNVDVSEFSYNKIGKKEKKLRKTVRTIEQNDIEFDSGTKETLEVTKKNKSKKAKSNPSIKTNSQKKNIPKINDFLFTKFYEEEEAYEPEFHLDFKLKPIQNEFLEW